MSIDLFAEALESSDMYWLLLNASFYWKDVQSASRDVHCSTPAAFLLAFDLVSDDSGGVAKKVSFNPHLVPILAGVRYLHPDGVLSLKTPSGVLEVPHAAIAPVGGGTVWVSDFNLGHLGDHPLRDGVVSHCRRVLDGLLHTVPAALGREGVRHTMNLANFCAAVLGAAIYFEFYCRNGIQCKCFDASQRLASVARRLWSARKNDLPTLSVKTPETTTDALPDMWTPSPPRWSPCSHSQYRTPSPEVVRFYDNSVQVPIDEDSSDEEMDTREDLGTPANPIVIN